MADVIEEIKKIAKTGKLYFGREETIKNLKLGKVSKVYVTTNCPEGVKADIAYYAELSGATVVQLAIPNDELGTICRKPFVISVLSVPK
ncbi:ribosomal L7Ae/L30e/S12e/Gadd45 family protein [Candidatus Woesearchaeota archaeon]|nr:ribosomal L7Ae/L30e/S12e/Gadd45 family protein [Candidatus Woesearchaeota archaeon]